jgi:hypothetical protein
VAAVVVVPPVPPVDVVESPPAEAVEVVEVVAPVVTVSASPPESSEHEAAPPTKSPVRPIIVNQELVLMLISFKLPRKLLRG